MRSLKYVALLVSILWLQKAWIIGDGEAQFYEINLDFLTASMIESLSLHVLLLVLVANWNEDHALVLWVSTSVDHSDFNTFDNNIFKFYCLFSALLHLLPNLEEAQSHVAH